MFIERLHGLYGAVPEAIRQSAELQSVFLPILRADVALLETHEFLVGERLDCPVTVLGGSGDPAISGEMLAGWREYMSGVFRQREFVGGGHFYLHRERDGVVALVVEDLL